MGVNASQAYHYCSLLQLQILLIYMTISKSGIKTEKEMNNKPVWEENSTEYYLDQPYLKVSSHMVPETLM